MPPTPPIALRPVAVAEGIHQIPVLSDNIIWIWVRAGKAVVVDPAVGDPVIAWLEERDLDLDAVLQTHHHSDHIGGTPALINRWPDAEVIAAAEIGTAFHCRRSPSEGEIRSHFWGRW